MQKRTNRGDNICRDRPSKVAVNGRNAWILTSAQNRIAARQESRPENRRRRSPSGRLVDPDRNAPDSLEVTLPVGRIGLKKKAASN
ncbi:membrane protein [Lasius niger]|uniref:Membrane protein n=1 Tax=Lasius niger TaxID=67767 RepID=A0A0J7KIR6_LASNI|nr:membrane protein [Lasius niger]